MSTANINQSRSSGSTEKLQTAGEHQMETQDDNSSEMPNGWIPWFCNVPGHEFFCEIDEEYVRDNFNLYGLRNRVQYYEHALEMVLMPDAPDEDDLQDADFLEVYRDAQDLYGLIHARYIISPRGLEVIKDLFMRGVYGHCPRVHCNSQCVLPVGTSDELRVSRVKTFCPKCEQLYATKSKYSDVDGAYFGTSFPHIFCLTFPAETMGTSNQLPVPYIPRLFGFRIYQHAGLIERHIQSQLQSSQDALAVKDKPDKEQAEGSQAGSQAGSKSLPGSLPGEKQDKAAAQQPAQQPGSGLNGAQPASSGQVASSGPSGGAGVSKNGNA